MKQLGRVDSAARWSVTLSLRPLGGWASERTKSCLKSFPPKQYSQYPISLESLTSHMETTLGTGGPLPPCSVMLSHQEWIHIKLRGLFFIFVFTRPMASGSFLLRRLRPLQIGRLMRTALGPYLYLQWMFPDRHLCDRHLCHRFAPCALRLADTHVDKAYIQLLLLPCPLRPVVKIWVSNTTQHDLDLTKGQAVKPYSPDVNALKMNTASHKPCPDTYGLQARGLVADAPTEVVQAKAAEPLRVESEVLVWQSLEFATEPPAPVPWPEPEPELGPPA